MDAFTFKIVCVGDTHCGKTTCINSYIQHQFEDGSLETIGVDLKIKHNVKTHHQLVGKLQIWDTAGQERFRSISNSYYRGAHGILLMYDITNRNSFDNVKYWLRDIRRTAKPNAVVYIVGNKNDLSNMRQIATTEAEQMAMQEHVKFMEISNRCNANVMELFSNLVNDISDECFGDRMNVRRGEQQHFLSSLPTSSNATAQTESCCCHKLW